MLVEITKDVRLWTLFCATALYLLRKSKRKSILKNEKVVILGASSGIGKALALLYAKRGASLVLVARRLQLLEQVKLECQRINSKAQVCLVAGDATQDLFLQKIHETTVENYGGCDTLILCMGVLSCCTFEELCQSHTLTKVMDSIFDTNVFAPIKCTNVFLDLLKQSKGKIAIVSSLGGIHAAPTRSLYCSTKFALNGFFDALRIELKSFGISIITLLPSSVETEFRQSSLDSSTGNDLNVHKGMSVHQCAMEMIQAIDARKRMQFIPSWNAWSPLLKFFFPDFIDDLAVKKYHFRSMETSAS